MKALSALALILSVVAIALAATSLAAKPLPIAERAAAPSAANDARLVAAEERAANLEKRVSSLSADVARLTAAQANAPMIAQNPAAPAEAASDEHIKTVVQAELQAQMDKMRAQWGGGQGGGAPQLDAAMLKQQLGVDDAKAEQLLAMATELRATTRDIFRQNKGGDRDGNLKLMQEERAKAEAKAAEILSPEELTKLKALLDQQRGPGGRRGGGGQGGQDGQRPGVAPAAPAPTGTGF